MELSPEVYIGFPPFAGEYENLRRIRSKDGCLQRLIYVRLCLVRSQIKRLSVEDYGQLTSNHGCNTYKQIITISCKEQKCRTSKEIDGFQACNPIFVQFLRIYTSAENAKPLLTKKIQWGTGEAVKQ